LRDEISESAASTRDVSRRSYLPPTDVSTRANRADRLGQGASPRVEVVSVDLSFAAVRFARDALAGTSEASFVQADVLALPFAPDSFDIATCALFLHHLPLDVGARLLRALYAIARRGVVVNDLHRHPLAYAGIWAVTRVLPTHPVVRHGAPLSVLRAFDRSDLADLARAAGLPVAVRWRWAFRYQW
jgi:SAM-dependent methyltransferase